MEKFHSCFLASVHWPNGYNAVSPQSHLVEDSQVLGVQDDSLGTGLRPSRGDTQSPVAAVGHQVGSQMAEMQAWILTGLFSLWLTFFYKRGTEAHV